MYPFGTAGFFGSMRQQAISAPVVGIASTPDGQGYWLVGADGGVYTFGDATFYGSIPSLGVTLTAAITGMARTPDGAGYWLVGADGGVFTFGDAPFEGSTGAIALGNVAGITSTPDGQGYWIVSGNDTSGGGSDGGVYGFGDGGFVGDADQPGLTLGGPIVGITSLLAQTSPPSPPPPPAQGYILAGVDGATYGFGSVPNDGSIYSFGQGSSQHWFGGNIVGIAMTPSRSGYWLASNNGLVCSFGSVDTYQVGGSWSSHGDWCFYQFSGSVTNIVGIESTSDGGGYWLVANDGTVYAFGDANFQGSVATYGNGTSQTWFSSNIVGMTDGPNQDGYWLAAANADTCSFGRVSTYEYSVGWGNLGGDWCWETVLGVSNAVGTSATNDGGGFWDVGADGGIFAFGDAGYYNSLPGLGVHVSNIVGMAPTPDDGGYLLAGSDGGVFAFGNATYYGGMYGNPALSGAIVGIAGT